MTPGSRTPPTRSTLSSPADTAARAAWVRTAARWVRKTPGYGLLTQRVLPPITRHPLVTDVVWRTFTPRVGAGYVDVPLRGGRELSGPDVSMLPVVGVVGTGLTEQGALGLVEEIADLQRRTLAFRPLLVLDQPLFGATRERDYVLELVLPERDWAFPGPWGDYLARRTASLIDHYQLWTVVRATPQGRLRDEDRALLEQLPGRLPDDLRIERS